jgi:hypothetical protein
MKLRLIHESGIIPRKTIIDWMKRSYNYFLENAGKDELYKEGPIPIQIRYKHDNREGLSIEGSFKPEDNIIRIVVYNYDRKSEEFLEELKRVVYEEILHTQDPKLTSTTLRTKSWGITDPEVMGKELESILSHDLEYHYTRPWEIDAKLGTKGLIRIEKWSEAGLSKEEIILRLKAMKPTDEEEKRLYKFGLWPKYLKFLYKYVSNAP